MSRKAPMALLCSLTSAPSSPKFLSQTLRYSSKSAVWAVHDSPISCALAKAAFSFAVNLSKAAL